MRPLQRIAIAASLLALAACAATPKHDVPVPAIPTAERFELSGRIGVKYDASSFSGSLRWRHGADRDEIWLYSPLGQTVANLRSDGSGAELLTADKKRYFAPDAEQLARNVLGWGLPLSGLQYWVVGQVAPHMLQYEVERDAEQRLALIQQDTWRIVFSRYATPEAGGLPDKLTLQYGTVEIKLLIDAWSDAADSR